MLLFLVGSSAAISRRVHLERAAFAALPALLSPLPTVPAHAADAQRGGATSAATAIVTDRVRLIFSEQFSPEEKREYSLVVGLFGDDAPASVATFKSLVAGTLNAPCADQMAASEAETLARNALAKRSVYKQCLSAEAEPVSYSYSQVWRITPRRIDAGQVRGKWAGRVPPSHPSTESASLSHDARGLVSVRRGGGSFDFGITTAPDAAADAESIVIGRVVEGSEALATLAALPVVSVPGQGEGMAFSREKACSYGGGSSFCAQAKPLKKLQLAQATIL